MSALRSGEFVPPPNDSYDPTADLRALQGSSREKRKTKGESETYMSRDQLMELRKVQAERIEVSPEKVFVADIRTNVFLQAGKMKLLGMEIKQTLGVRMDGTMFDD